MSYGLRFFGQEIILKHLSGLSALSLEKQFPLNISIGLHRTTQKPALSHYHQNSVNPRDLSKTLLF